MPLIEGFGDEVTIIFAVIIALVVIAFIGLVSSPVLSNTVNQIFPWNRNINSSRNEVSTIDQTSDCHVTNRNDDRQGSTEAANENVLTQCGSNEATTRVEDVDAVDNLPYPIITSPKYEPLPNFHPDTPLAYPEESLGYSPDIDRPDSSSNISYFSAPQAAGSSLFNGFSENDSDSVINFTNEIKDNRSSETFLRQRHIEYFDKKATGSSFVEKAPPLSVSCPKPMSENGKSPSEAASSEQSAACGGHSVVNDGPNIDSNRDQILVRLVHLNDTQREVYAKPSDTIAEFRRVHFADEISNNKLVRFIYNGQVLADSSTLKSSNITHNSAVHCLITNQQTDLPSTSVEVREVDLSRYLFPSLVLLLLLMWYLRFVYKRYFNTMSTFLLISITILFILFHISPVLDMYSRHRARYANR